MSSPSLSQTEGKHSPVFVSCYLPPHVVKSICMKCFDALRDPDGVTIVSICPIVTRIDRSVVIFTPHMSVAGCSVVSLNIAWPGWRGQGSGVTVGVSVSRAGVVMLLTPT